MTSEININTETIDSLRELLEDDFGQLITTYVDDTDTRIAALKSAIENQDLESVANQAHAIKGSSRNLGINEISDVSSDLEEQARAGETENFVQYYEQIAQFFAASKTYLLTLI